MSNIDKGVRTALLLGAALGCLAPGAASAQSGGTAALEERVRQLEAALAAVRAELDTVKSTEAQRAQQADQRLITLERTAQGPAATAPAAAPQDGFTVAGATVKIGGYVKAEALISEYGGGDLAAGTGRDYYVPASIPVGAPGTAEDADFDAHAKQTRLTLTINRPVEGHTLGAYVEGDFQSASGTQGSERLTNAYNFALRRAYVTYDNWLFGQDWSTFMNVGVLPETPDFIGPSEGTIFIRQPVARYTHKFADGRSFVLALENPETTVLLAGTGTLVDLDDDTLPDLVARYNGKAGKVEYTVAGLLRQLSSDGPIAGFATVNDEAVGWGLSTSAKIPFANGDDIRVMLSGGEGVGRYLGLGFAPDAVAIGGARARIEPISVVNGFVAYRHLWTQTLRSTATLSYINVDNDPTAGAAANRGAWSGAVNLFWSPVAKLDLGIEYRHAERAIRARGDGDLDRLHLVAKHSF